MIRKNISDCYVTAPLAGMITNSTYEIGETAGPGSILFTISKMDTVELVVYVNEKELGYVKLGRDAEIRIDSFKDKAFIRAGGIYLAPGRIHPQEHSDQAGQGQAGLRRQAEDSQSRTTA